ncbi:hypothetical protein OROHE_006485 [Orobanche hederae]
MSTKKLHEFQLPPRKLLLNRRQQEYGGGYAEIGRIGCPCFCCLSHRGTC